MAMDIFDKIWIIDQVGGAKADYFADDGDPAVTPSTHLGFYLDKTANTLWYFNSATYAWNSVSEMAATTADLTSLSSSIDTNIVNIETVSASLLSSGTDIDSVSGSLLDAESDIVVISAAVISNAEDLATISAAISNSDTNISALSTAIDSTNTDVQAVSSQVTTNQTNITSNTEALTAKADLVGGTVPSSQLPSYVDDVIEVSTVANLSAEGEAGKIYVTTDENETYRWSSGTTYVPISNNLDAEDIATLYESLSNTNKFTDDFIDAITGNTADITTVSGDVIDNTTDITNISGDVIDNTTNVENITGDVENLTTNVENVTGDIENLTTNVENITGDIFSISGDVINNTTNVENITGDVENLTTNVENITGDVENLTTNVENVTGDIVTLSGDVISNTTNVENITGDVENLTTNVENVTGDIVTLSGDVINNTTNVENITGDIENLTTNVENITGDIENLTTNVENVTGDIVSISGDVINNTTNVENITGDIENLTTNVENVTGDIENLTTNVENVTGDIVSISGDVIDNSTNITTVSGDVIDNSTNITTVSGDVIDNSTNLTELSSTVIDNNTIIESLSTSIIENDSGTEEISGDVINNTADITTISGDVMTNTTDITTVSGDVINNTTDITTVSGDVINNTTDITTVSGDVINNTTEIENITGDVETITTNIENITGDVETITTNIENITGDVETITTNIENITGDVETITTNIENITGDIETITTNIENVTGDIFSISGDVITNTTSIENITGDIETITTNIENVTGDIFSISGDVITNTTNIESVTADIADINTSMDEMSSILSAISTEPFSGATSSADGLSGVVPTPLSGQEDYTLHGDGTWRESTAGSAGKVFITDVVKRGACTYVDLVYGTGNDEGTVTAATVNADTVYISVEWDRTEYYGGFPTVSGVSLSAFETIKVGNTYSIAEYEATIPSGNTITFDYEGETASLSCDIITTEAIFSGVLDQNYPGSQTELKENDIMSATIYADTNTAFTEIEISGMGCSKAQSIGPFSSTESYVFTYTIPDNGDSTTSADMTFRIKTTFDDTWKEWDVSENEVVLNNTYPVATITGYDYPGDQLALKDEEEAIVSTSFTDADSTTLSNVGSQLKTISITSVGANTSVYADSPGVFNNSATNLQITGTRTANDATTTTNGIVVIADIVPALSDNTEARLRSGFTSVDIACEFNQDIVITGITHSGYGTLLSEATTVFSETYTLQMSASASDPHSTTQYDETLSAYNMAHKLGVVDRTYALRGFAERPVTFDYYAPGYFDARFDSDIGVEVVDPENIRWDFHNITPTTMGQDEEFLQTSAYTSGWQDADDLSYATGEYAVSGSVFRMNKYHGFIHSILWQNADGPGYYILPMEEL